MPTAAVVRVRTGGDYNNDEDLRNVVDPHVLPADLWLDDLGRNEQGKAYH